MTLLDPHCTIPTERLLLRPYRPEDTGPLFTLFNNRNVISRLSPGAFVQHVFKSAGADAIYAGAFAENTASLRVQDKIGFVRDGETTLFSRPRGGDFPHVNTVRTRFEQLVR